MLSYVLAGLLLVSTPFAMPDRRGGEFQTETTLASCRTEDGNIVTIERVSFDTHPTWDFYEYLGFYRYAENEPYIAVRFDEDGDMIDARLYGIPIAPDDLMRVTNRDPCGGLDGTWM